MLAELAATKLDQKIPQILPLVAGVREPIVAQERLRLSHPSGGGSLEEVKEASEKH